MTPTKSSASAFPENKAITTPSASSQKNKYHCKCWQGLIYRLGFLFIFNYPSANNTCINTFILTQPGFQLSYTIHLHHVSYSLPIEKYSLSTPRCNSDYLNYFSSPEQLINYEKTTPKIPLASGQIPIHLQQKNSEQFVTRGLKNSSILSATQYFCASYIEFKVLPHPFLRRSLFLCNVPIFRKCKLIFFHRDE